jgi:uncharacterized protein YggE
MFVRLMVVLALMLPAVALAQTGDKSVRVEIVATGTVEVPATSYKVTLNWTSTGDNEVEARGKQEQNRAAVRAAVAKAGLPANALVIVPVRSGEIAFPVIVADASDSAGEPGRKSYGDRGVLRLTSLDQLESLEASLEKLDVTFGRPIAEAGDPASLRRQAKSKAVGVAREDALAYAATLGMRNVRIVRISEKSDGMLPFGMQDKFGEMMSGGPEALRTMFDNDSPGTVRVVAGVLVEFVIEP